MLWFGTFKPQYVTAALDQRICAQDCVLGKANANGPRMRTISSQRIFNLQDHGLALCVSIHPAASKEQRTGFLAVDGVQPLLQKG